MKFNFTIQLQFTSDQIAAEPALGKREKTLKKFDMKFAKL